MLLPLYNLPWHFLRRSTYRWSFLASFTRFAAIFAVTQVPLAIMEGAVSALLFKYVVNVKSDILVEMKVLEDAVVRKLRGTSA